MEPLLAKDDDNAPNETSTAGPYKSIPPLIGLAVFVMCVLSSLLFYFDTTVSNAFERQLNDIMASSKLCTFEVSMIMTILVSGITMFYTYSNIKTKAKMIELAWAITVCVFIAVAVYFSTNSCRRVGITTTITNIKETTDIKMSHEKKNKILNFLAGINKAP